MTLNAAGGTIDTAGQSSTFNGVFSGAGGFAKAGAGTLTLGGASTYSGVTNVNAGTLTEDERFDCRSGQHQFQRQTFRHGHGRIGGHDRDECSGRHTRWRRPHRWNPARSLNILGDFDNHGQINFSLTRRTAGGVIAVQPLNIVHQATLGGNLHIDVSHLGHIDRTDSFPLIFAGSITGVTNPPDPNYVKPLYDVTGLPIPGDPSKIATMSLTFEKLNGNRSAVTAYPEPNIANMPTQGDANHDMKIDDKDYQAFAYALFNPKGAHV